jgi:hypothetical protein
MSGTLRNSVDYDEDVPGTVRQLDLNGDIPAKKAGGKHKDIVLFPSPTTDPDGKYHYLVAEDSLVIKLFKILSIGLAVAKLFIPLAFVFILLPQGLLLPRSSPFLTRSRTKRICHGMT